MFHGNVLDIKHGAIKNIEHHFFLHLLHFFGSLEILQEKKNTDTLQPNSSLT